MPSTRNNIDQDRLDYAVRRVTNPAWREIFTTKMTKPETWLLELSRCPWSVKRIRAIYNREHE